MIDNLKKVLSLIHGGNNFGERITLVGATKMVDYATINTAIEHGLEVVAENKVQEFREKTEFISKKAIQHFIGHLQTNKVKYLVGNVALIQSVDSIRLCEEVNRIASKKNLVQDVLLEVNVGGEISKSGFNPDNVCDAAFSVYNDYKNLRVKGLMAMLPHSDDEDLLGGLCDKMRALYDDLKAQGLPFEYLSVGMSNDYLTAIKHGSNMIRLGRTIFGQRNYGSKN